MKKPITLFALLIGLGLSAQEFSGKATYRTKTIFKETAEESGAASKIDPEMMNQIREAMKKSSEKTFILEFSKSESLYREEEKIEQPSTNSGGISISFYSSGDNKLYKNLKENYSLLEDESLGKLFQIKDTLHISGWELHSESKKIGNYTVYKATKTIKAKIIEASDETKEEKPTGLLVSMITSEPKDIVYTAWYTPEIPVANGPEKFGGLPGLILELNTGHKVYLCSEIVLNPKKPVAIKVPKGKVISQQEYDKMMEKRFKNSKGGAVEVQTITIGG